MLANIMYKYLEYIYFFTSHKIIPTRIRDNIANTVLLFI